MGVMVGVPAVRAPDRARIKVWTVGLKVRGEHEDEGGVQGIFECYPSIFGNVDSYGERVVKGAFSETLKEWKEKGIPIPVLWAHQWDNPEAHLGIVTEAEERDRGLWVKAQLDLGEPFVDKVWHLLTHRRVNQFSFAFDVLEGGESEDKEDTFYEPLFDSEVPVYELRRLKLYEVGPCLVGVNQETELLSTKSVTVGAARRVWGFKGPVGSHSTSVVDTDWDAAAVRRNTRSDEDASYYRRIFAWQNPDGDVGAISTWSFPHHQVSAQGEPGAAVLRGCSAGIAVLNGGRGGADIPSGDRQGIWNHLARHMRDGDAEPPELASRHAETRQDPPKQQVPSSVRQALGSIRERASAIVSAVDDLTGEEEEEETEQSSAAPSTATVVTGEPSSSPQRREHWPSWLRSGTSAGGSDGPVTKPPRRSAGDRRSS